MFVYRYVLKDLFYWIFMLIIKWLPTDDTNYNLFLGADGTAAGSFYFFNYLPLSRPLQELSILAVAI